MNTHTLCFYSQTKRLPASEVLKYALCNAILCPTVIPRICACGKQILIDWKLFFGYMVQWQQVHRTAEGQRTTAFHRTMYLLPLDHLSKLQLSTNQNLLKFAAWPLDMYHSFGHVSPCLVWSETKQTYEKSGSHSKVDIFHYWNITFDIFH